MEIICSTVVILSGEMSKLAFDGKQAWKESVCYSL